MRCTWSLKSLPSGLSVVVGMLLPLHNVGRHLKDDGNVIPEVEEIAIGGDLNSDLITGRTVISSAPFEGLLLGPV